MPDPQKLSVDDFAAKVKAKYPDYADVDNSTLVQKVLSKYPEYGDQVDMQAGKTASAPAPQGAGARYLAQTGLTSDGRGLLEQANAELTAMVNHPMDTAIEAATAPVKGFLAAKEAQGQRASEHWQRAKSTGDPRDYLDAAAHGLYYLLTPMGGENLGRAADLSAKGDLAGAAGAMTLPVVSMMFGSPSVRSGTGSAVNAARSGAATLLEKSAKPVGAVAGGVGALTEAYHGNFGPASLSAVYGKPAITKGMNAVASILKPGEAPIEAMPLTRQVLGSEAFRRFLNAPGIEGEPPAQSAPKPQLLLPAGQYEMPASGAAQPGATPPEYMMSPENEAADRSIIGRRLPPQSNSQFLSGLRDHEIIRRINQSFDKQAGAGEETVKQWIVDHDQNAPGGKSGTYLKAAKNSLGKDASPSQVADLALKLKRQDTDMAGMLQESLDKIQSGQQADTQTGRMASLASKAEQGGHAGGGVTSVEELSRTGINYIINKSGKLTYHGKSFAPEETPAGGTHVTVFPDGKFRVNNGVLTESQALMLRKAINEK